MKSGDNMREIVKKYRSEKYDYSCSETIIHAANEKYNLNLSSNEFKMMAPFSGGMYDGDVCGIVTASISVLGILLTNQVSHQSPLLKEAVLEYKERFNEINKSTICRDLVITKRKEDSGCSDFIIDASDLLVEIIDKYVK